MTELPKRVFNIGTKNSTPKLHISEPEEQGRYVALSYCWGGPQRFTTTSATLESRISGIQLASLPKTILDAISVTRKLGIRLLWVDCLCIIQDSEEDSLQEISTMGEIYKNATVMIAAANSQNVEDGFLTDRPPLELCPVPVSLAPNELGTIYLAKDGYPRPERVPDDPLFSRGWTFQEFLLSPRVLLYDNVQVTWHCHKDSFKGLYENFIAYMYRTKKHFASMVQRGPDNLQTYPKPSRLWESLIEEYSGRAFTHFEDRLPAIAGIAKDFSSQWNEEYHAGLWRGFLVTHLGWFKGSRDPFPPAKKPPFEPFANHNERIGRPSWSWKSAPFAVRFRAVVNPVASVMWCRVKLALPKAPFGDVLEGTLVLQCRVVSVRDRTACDAPEGKN